MFLFDYKTYLHIFSFIYQIKRDFETLRPDSEPNGLLERFEADAPILLDMKQVGHSHLSSGNYAS